MSIASPNTVSNTAPNTAPNTARNIAPNAETDAPVVIIGAGLAGLTVALHLAQTRKVVVLAKRNLNEAATAWAQGGIVGVLGSDDSIASHVNDTQDAGGGLVDEHTARFIAEHSAEAIQWLVDRGVPFTTDPDGPLGLHLTRAKAAMRCGASRTRQTPPAKPSTMCFWTKWQPTPTSSCVSAGWRWTSSPHAC